MLHCTTLRDNNRAEPYWTELDMPLWLHDDGHTHTHTGRQLPTRPVATTKMPAKTMPTVSTMGSGNQRQALTTFTSSSSSPSSLAALLASVRWKFKSALANSIFLLSFFDRLFFAFVLLQLTKKCSSVLGERAKSTKFEKRRRKKWKINVACNEIQLKGPSTSSSLSLYSSLSPSLCSFSLSLSLCHCIKCFYARFSANFINVTFHTILQHFHYVYLCLPFSFSLFLSLSFQLKQPHKYIAATREKQFTCLCAIKCAISMKILSL